MIDIISEFISLHIELRDLNTKIKDISSVPYWTLDQSSLALLARKEELEKKIATLLDSMALWSVPQVIQQAIMNARWERATYKLCVWCGGSGINKPNYTETETETEIVPDDNPYGPSYKAD